MRERQIGDHNILVVVMPGMQPIIRSVLGRGGSYLTQLVEMEPVTRPPLGMEPIFRSIVGAGHPYKDVWNGVF